MEEKLELIFKNGYNFWIQYPEITIKQLKYFQTNTKKGFVDLC